jgi:hypothetical protein
MAVSWCWGSRSSSAQAARGTACAEPHRGWEQQLLTNLVDNSNVPLQTREVKPHLRSDA